MPALFTIQPIVLLHRPRVPESLTYYDRKVDQDRRDPCVWIFEGDYGSSLIRYSRFYASEIIALLKTAATIPLAADAEQKQIGPLRHTSAREHELTFKAEADDPACGRKHDFEVTLSNMWFNQPFFKIAHLIEQYQADMPAECVQVWPETRALKTEFMQYVERLKNNTQPGALNFNPISIKIEQA